MASPMPRLPWRRTWRPAVALTALALAAGCARAPETPDLARIYAGAAQGAGEVRPLITVPGTLGTRLVDRQSGAVLWGGGGSRGLSADPEDPEEARLIALPIVGPETEVAAIGDGVATDGVLDTTTARVLGIPIEFEVYGGVRRLLEAGGFKPIGGTTDMVAGIANDQLAPGVPLDMSEVALRNFGFGYDWRRDLVSLAQEFGRFIAARARAEAELESVETGQRVDPAAITFDLLAHSMGGLVARYFLMHGPADLPEDGSLPPITWEGAHHFRRVVFVAPPNAGSVLALDNLVNGKTFGPLQPTYPAALLATHPATYALLPRARHGRVRLGSDDGPPVADLYDGQLWERMGWGLADPEAAELLAWLMPETPDPAERRARAVAHQSRLLRRAEQFHRAIDRWTPPPPSLDLYLVVGGGFRTPAGGVVDPATGTFRLTTVEEGDGVVLRASALADERPGAGRGRGGGLQSPLRFQTTLFLPDEHVRLTMNPVFGDNLLFWLLEQPRAIGDLAEPEAAEMLAELPPAKADLTGEAAGRER